MNTPVWPEIVRLHAKIAELENALSESQAEVQFYKKSVRSYVDACKPIREMADKLGLKLGECIIQHGVPRLLESHKKAEAQWREWKKKFIDLEIRAALAALNRNRIGVEIRGEYLPKLRELTSEVHRLRSQLNRAVEIAEELSSGDVWKFTGAEEKLDALKSTLNQTNK